MSCSAVRRDWRTALLALLVGAPVAMAVQVVPYFPSADDAVLEGFVRIINQSPRDGVVNITAIDDSGLRIEGAKLSIAARQAIHFNSTDLQEGNENKGLSGGIGSGEGDWRLELTSDLDLIVLPYVRTADGFVTAMQEVAPRVEGRYHVVFFNPGSNWRQESLLRLINAGTAEAQVTITGFDDAGRSSAGAVRTSIRPGASFSITALELESGATDSGDSLGDGAGKWQLFVESTQPMMVMSLLRNPTGNVTNLSAIPLGAVGSGRDGPDMIASPGTEVILGSAAILDCAGTGASYRWGQLSGPEVSLNDRAAAPRFTVPEGAQGLMAFRVEATCGANQQLSDIVTLNIVPPRVERVLSALVDFEDVDPADRPLSRADLAGLLADDADSLANYLAAASRGLVDVRFDVLDWVTVGKRRSDYPSGGGDVVQDVVSRLSEVRDLGGYDKVFPAIFPLEKGYPGCKAFLTPERFRTTRGTFQLGAAWLSGYDMGCVRKGRHAHEYGHTFGIVHSLALLCHTETGVPVSTIDPTDRESCHIVNECVNEDCTQLREGDARLSSNLDPDMLGDDQASYYENYFPMVYQATWQAYAGWLAAEQIVTMSGSHWITSLESLSPTPKAIRVRLGRDHAGGVQEYLAETRLRVPDAYGHPAEACSLAVRLAVPNRYTGQSFRGWGDSGHTDTLRVLGLTDVTNPRSSARFRSVRAGEAFRDPFRGVRITLADCVEREHETAVKVEVARSELRAEPPLVAVLRNRATSVTVTNQGARAVNMGQPSIGGRHMGAFTIGTEDCGGAQLRPGRSCRIEVESQTASESVAFLRIPNDDELAPELTVSLVVGLAPDARRGTAPLPLEAVPDIGATH